MWNQMQLHEKLSDIGSFELKTLEKLEFKFKR